MRHLQPYEKKPKGKLAAVIISIAVILAVCIVLGVIILPKLFDGSKKSDTKASSQNTAASLSSEAGYRQDKNDASAEASGSDADMNSDNASVPETTEKPKVDRPASFQIEDVTPIFQSTLKAGCETYAATMCLQILGFDVDEFTIADNYLHTYYITVDGDGVKHGPDMHSAFAGSAYAGWGVYAPSMAKSMNEYLQDQHSDLTAYAYKDIPLEDLIDDYVIKGIPVMVWATTDMDEPYVFDSWVVDYVDENAEAELGDTVDWYMHEHCLVLIGYDEDEYYFADSTHGTISHFDKELVAERYKQMFSQCIVVK